MELDLIKTKRKMLNISTSSSADNIENIDLKPLEPEYEENYEATGQREDYAFSHSKSFHEELLELQEKNESLEEFIKQKDVCFKLI